MMIWVAETLLFGLFFCFSNADWLSTQWDVIVVGKLALQYAVTSTNESGAGPAGIIVADRMSEAGLQTYV